MKTLNFSDHVEIAVVAIVAGAIGYALPMAIMEAPSRTPSILKVAPLLRRSVIAVSTPPPPIPPEVATPIITSNTVSEMFEEEARTPPEPPAPKPTVWYKKILGNHFS